MSEQFISQVSVACAELLSLASLVLAVVLSLVFFYLAGCIVKKALLLKTFSFGENVPLGLSVMLLLLYYFGQLGISFSSTALIVTFLVPVLSVLLLVRQTGFKPKRLWLFLTNNVGFPLVIAIIVSVIFAVQYIIVYGFAHTPVGCIGNNDIFSWALTADALTSRANPQNIVPNGPAYYEHTASVCVGTITLLALYSKWLGLSSLEATSFLAISLLAACMTTVSQCLDRYFRPGKLGNGAICIVLASSIFFFYIAHNGFYSQLAGTLLFLALLDEIVRVQEGPSHYSLAKHWLIASVLVSGILLVYPSGLMPFVATVGVAAIAVGILQLRGERFARGSANLAHRLRAFRPLLMLAFAVAGGLLLVPALALTTVRWALHVGEVDAGWPLPLISPTAGLAIPMFHAFPEAGLSIIVWIIPGILIAATLMMLLYYNSKPSTQIIGALSLIIALFFSIAIYILFYLLKGEIYQTWKLCSFLVLPLAFALFGGLASIFNRLNHRQRIIPSVVYCSIALVGIVHAVYVGKQFQSADVFTEAAIDSAKQIARNLKKDGVQDVVLATPPYRETMLLFPYLTRDFRVFPLSTSYVHPSEPDDLPCLHSATTRVITARSERHAGNTTIVFDQQRWNELNESCFSFASASSNMLQVANATGLSGPEHWGRWTDGRTAYFDITNLPLYLDAKELLLSLYIKPFGTQTVTITADGHVSQLDDLNEPAVVSVVLSQSQLSDGRVSVRIDVRNPVSPSSLDPASADTRQLGVGLINANLKEFTSSHQ